MTPPDPAAFVVRVVYVPGGAGAADARRRVVDVLLRAAGAAQVSADATAPPAPVDPSPGVPGENAA